MSEVRSTVRIDMAGNIQDGLKAVAKQADSAAQAVSKLNQTAGAGGGPGSPSGIGPGYNQSILQAEAARRMSDQQLNAYMAQHKAAEERRKLVENENKSRMEAANAAAMREQSMQTMAMQGLAFSGMGGAAGGYGRGMMVGSALEGMGYAGLARYAGPAGLAIGATAQYADMLKRQEAFNPFAINADPNLDPVTRGRGYLKSMPLGETALSYYDTFSGRTAGYARNEEARARLGARSEHEVRMSSAMGDFERQTGTAQARVDSMQRFPYSPMRFFDRSSASGERQQREESAMVEPRRAAVRAERELSIAIRDREGLEKRSLGLAEQRKNVSVDIKLNEELVNKLQTDQANLTAKEIQRAGTARSIIGGIIGGPMGIAFGTGSALAGIGTGGDEGVGVNAARGRLAEFYKTEQSVKSEQQKNQAAIVEAKKREAELRKANEFAKAQVARAELGVLQSREQLASGSAKSIGGMGIAGREIGLTALEQVKALGIENAPAELIQAAESVAPQYVAKLKEQLGTELAGGGFGNRLRALGADEDIRDVGNLKGLRNEVDKASKKAFDIEGEAEKKFAGDSQAALDNFKKLITYMAEELPIRLMQLENDLRISRN